MKRQPYNCQIPLIKKMYELVNRHECDTSQARYIKNTGDCRPMAIINTLFYEMSILCWDLLIALCVLSRLLLTTTSA